MSHCRHLSGWAALTAGCGWRSLQHWRARTLRWSAFLVLGVDRLTTGCLTICLSSLGVSAHEHLHARRGHRIFRLSAPAAGRSRLLSAFAGEGPRRATSTLVLGFASLALGALAHPPTFATAGLFFGLPAAVLGIGFVSSCAGVDPTATDDVGFGRDDTCTVSPSGCTSQSPSEPNSLSPNRSATSYYFPLSIDHWLARFWPFSTRPARAYRRLQPSVDPVSVRTCQLDGALLAAVALRGRYLRPFAMRRVT